MDDVAGDQYHPVGRTNGYDDLIQGSHKVSYSRNHGCKASKEGAEYRISSGESAKKSLFVPYLLS